MAVVTEIPGLRCPERTGLLLGTERQSLIHNERVKLLANALNSAASSSFAIGVLAPIAAALYNVGGVSTTMLTAIVFGVVFWVGLAIALHLLARHVLGGLKEG